MLKRVIAVAAAMVALHVFPARAQTTPPFNWTGGYVGLNAGGAWGRTDPTTGTVYSPVGYFASSSVGPVTAAGQQDGHTAGFMGGGQFGYNNQINNNLVAGIEADLDYIRLRSHDSKSGIYPCCAPTGFTVSSSVSADWLLTLRPRIGWLATPDILVYATGGLALSNVRGDFRFGDTFAGAAESGTISGLRAGWVAGGGLEYAVTANWSVKGEYLYVDFGHSEIQSTNLSAFGGSFAFPSNIFTHSFDPRLSIIRLGVNYRY